MSTNIKVRVKMDGMVANIEVLRDITMIDFIESINRYFSTSEIECVEVLDENGNATCTMKF